MKTMDLKNIIQESLRKVVNNAHDSDINVSIYFEELGPSGLIHHANLYPQDYYYPASLIKLFNAYLAKIRLQERIPQILKERDPESTSFGARTFMDDIYDAIHESLKSSDNDALAHLVDFNSHTTPGLRLDPEDFAAFRKARQSISEFFISKGYSKDLNLANRCFSFAPYGRETQLVFEEGGLGSNRLTFEDIAHIMHDIRQNFPELLQSMRRRIGDELDEQCAFIAKGLEPIKDKVAEYYSKAGWTSKVRHDAAYIKMKNGKEYILVIMTKNLSQFPDLIPTIASSLISS